MENLKSLAETVKYQNDVLVGIFAIKKQLPTEEAYALFYELKKWLWFLGSRSINAAPFPIFPEQCILDDFWHEFILSTKDYHSFCDNFIGRYIHHVPTPGGVLQNDDKFGVSVALLDKRQDEYFLKKSILLKNSMREVAAVLGVETVELWYRTYAFKYYIGR